MLVIKVELWPHGDESRKKNLGIAHIANDGTGNLSRGNYWVKLFKWDTGKRVWKEGEFKDFPRIKLGPWDILYRALSVTVGDRNCPKEEE